MKTLIGIASLVCLSACLVEGQDLGEVDRPVVTATQVLQTCTASCAYPTWNGVPVSCSTSIYCVAHANGVYCDTGGTPITQTCSACGNGSCDAGETRTSCAIDCGCGNGICDGDETQWSCPSDCNYCGDGYCNAGEGSASCGADCWCGDGICDSDEAAYNWCPYDCGQSCSPHVICPIY